MATSLDPFIRARADYIIRAWRGAGFPLVLVSGYRSPDHNAAVGGAPASRHLLGRAVDLGFSGYSTKSVPEPVWRALGKWGEALGLRWGGRFTTYDPVHFDF